MSDDFSKYVKMCFEWGDESILEVLLECHGASFGFVLKRKFPSISTDDVDDVILEALEALWRYKGRFDPEKGDIAGWFFSIASKKASDLLQDQDKRRREKYTSDFSQIQAAVQSLDLDESAESQLQTDLRAILSKLSVSERDFLIESVRNDVEGYTPQLVADPDASSTDRRKEKGRLRKRKHDLLKRLRNSFMKRGYNPDDQRRYAEITPKIVKVLLAEDISFYRRKYSSFFRELGVNVVAVEDGQIAFDEALTAHQSGQPFDLVVLDAGLPKIMGYEVANRLRKANVPAKYIGLTQEPRWMQLCVESCDCLYKKPFERHHAQELIHSS